MKIKTFLSCWLPTFVVMFGLNGAFHGKLAAPFFDAQLSQLEPAIHKMGDINPLWVTLLDFVLTFGMTYFVLVRQTGLIKASDAAFAGALVNLVAAGTWNFANAAMFSWSNTVTIADIAWHVCLGAAGGSLIAAIYNRLYRKGSH